MSLVKFEIKTEFVGELILNRPEKMNAFSGEMMRDFLNALLEAKDAISKNKVRVVLLRSAAAPKAFCAGADLGERIKMSIEEVSATLKTQRSIMDSVASLEVPVIASVSGIAFGGGLELALCADYRVLLQSAQIGLTETKLAIIPGAGGTQRLRNIVGEAKAKELILFAKKLSAGDALICGLANEVSLDADATAMERARELLQAGPVALSAAKKAIEGYRQKSTSTDLDFERRCYEMVLNTQDRVEGLKAFVEKRNPQYQGK
jgi:enoyl-CoA hydratase/carnithine racemase